MAAPRFLMVIAAVTSIHQPALSAGDDFLVGLKEVSVVVEGLNSSLRRAGLEESQLESFIERRLRQNGIKVDDQAENFLYLNVSTVGVLEDPGTGVGRHAYSTDLELRRPMVPMSSLRDLIQSIRNETEKGKASVPIEYLNAIEMRLVRLARFRTAWQRHGRFGLVSESELENRIRSTVADHVDDFLNDYLAANPRESSKE